jgi:predicted transcriptional regulator
MKTIAFRVSKKLSKDLKQIAKEKGISLSDVVRESLARYVVVRRFRKAREHILPFAEKAGIVTDEDAFRVFAHSCPRR